MSYPRRPKVILDLPAYMRQKNAERRAAARRAGICTSCNSDDARPGRAKCETCAMIETERRRAA